MLIGAPSEVEKDTNKDKTQIWHMCCWDIETCSHAQALCGTKFKGGPVRHEPHAMPDDCVVCIELWEKQYDP